MKIKLDYVDTINLKLTIAVLRKKGMSYIAIAQLLKMEYDFQEEHPFKLSDTDDNRQEYTNGIQI